MHRSKKKRNIVIISLIIILLAMVVGYATYSSNIELEGTTKITSNWDIRITNVTEGTPTGDAENAKTPTWKNTEASMEANLYSKGDAMEYDVTIENKGNLDAKLNDVLTNIENANSEAVNITFTGYTKGEILKANQKKIVHVKIEYNPNYEGEETSSEVNINFDYTQNNNETEGEENLYLIKYDCITNGGQDCSNNNEYLLTGSDIDLTKTGTKENAEFIGWNTNKDETKGLTNLKVENKDITLYAIFKSNDITEPVIDNISTKATTNSITAIVSAHDDESGITKYEFSINNGEYIDNGNNNTYTFTNLKSDTNYTIKVRVTNGANLQAEKTAGGINIKDSVVTEGDGLYEDEYEENRYIYKGKNVNNYITFNNEKAGWRIVSLESDGTIKIMREANINEIEWDTFETYGSNNWTRPATLNTYLNGSYLTDTLNATAQNQIVAKDWSIGAVDIGDENLSNSIKNENSKKWNGKVALPSASDYIKSNSDQIMCGSMIDVLNAHCGNTTWMHNNTDWWTITAHIENDYVILVYNNGGSFQNYLAYNSEGVRPAVYLSSDLTLKGEGTKEKPFEINDSSITLPKLQKPTFTESGTLPKTVTITYPEGCGENLTCTYQKDDEETVEVNSKTVDVGFNDNGTLLAKVTDGTNEESNIYNVTVGIDVTDNVVTEGDGLYKDKYEENRYIYKGTTPNNYVSFNNELWRIISIEPNSSMKIIRNASIGSKQYDQVNTRPTTTNTYCKESASYGCQVWGAIDGNYSNDGSSITGTVVNDSSLNTYLNGDYYNTLTETAKEQINNGIFNIGTINIAATNLKKTITQEKAYTWQGKFGLVNASDYIKASTYVACTSINYAYNNTGCKNSNYLFKSSAKLVTLNGRSNNSKAVVYANTDGKMNNQQANKNFAVFPVTYLNTSVKIISGEGTQSNPYQLQISKTIEKPTFAETGDNPKTVIITYPEGCGDKYTCSYKKDNEESVNVTSSTANVQFNKNGSIVATVSDGINTVTNSYNVIISTGGNSILEEVDIVDSGDGLYKDENECRYFFAGKNPNNYITFNNGKSKWRILSIECDGTIKIIRNESIGNKQWNTSSALSWDTPTALNTYLNGAYLTETLNQTSQSQIVAHNFSIGAFSVDDIIDLKEQINNENSKKWTGKIALPTLTEYLRTNSDINCHTYDYYSRYYNTCKNNTWMNNETSYWTLTPHANFVYSVEANGMIGMVGNYNDDIKGTRPTLYLSSFVQITGGNGSQNNPYTLGNVVLKKPTFKESGENPKTVTITYPEGCGETITCSYKKDNEESVNITSSTVDVQFNKSGSIVATVSEGTNTVTSSYTVNISSTGGNQILDKVDIVTEGDGLYKDEYEEGRYIYKGANVNNYITFNNEVWRIVSIEPDKTIKIMRDASIGDRAWDSSNSNNWKRPADLNTYLNGSYLTGTLNQAAQSQIVAKDFSIGSVSYNDTSLSNSINNENSKKWNGKVALITASEYIRSNSNQSSCGNMKQVYSSTTCKNTTWMYINKFWWTLSPVVGDSYVVFRVNSDGNFYSYNNASVSNTAVRPSVYLSSEVKITGGDGSANNPYTLG